jgi:excisionase family DNA binding protein
MKKTWLTAKELATLLQVSIKTVRRAYRNGEIPMSRFRHMVRFDLAQVRRTMARNGRSRVRRLNGGVTQQGATAGQGRRRARKSPRTVKRGRNFQGSKRRVS